MFVCFGDGMDYGRMFDCVQVVQFGVKLVKVCMGYWYFFYLGFFGCILGGINLCEIKVLECFWFFMVGGVL